jgi:hypothetical protein
MKTFITLAAAISLGSAALGQPIQETVAVHLGPKAFRDGDLIQIEEVRSTSPHLEQGDTITVKGRYRLDSQDEANLQLHVTQMQGDGTEEIEARQTVKVSRGFKPFEVTITVKHKGYLHLTFYDAQSGNPLGGTYFGSAKQMSQAAEIPVSHYLD